ncbi:DUF6301 family protein [Nocardia sp. NPDC050697]|uniref:DUF6301 family protein n=1 Tax=Nocardia sp. NPDC050697 TaxID=3155158 RepID=UPI0033F31F57
MHVDIDRAVRAVRAAQEFAWSWTVADLPVFAAAVGWTLVDIGKEYPRLVTDLAVNRPETSANIAVPPSPFPPGQLNRIGFDVTDVVLDDPEVQLAVDEAFDEFVHQLFVTLRQGPTSSWAAPTRGLRWEFPHLVLEVTPGSQKVWVSLINPAYHHWYEEITELARREAEEEADDD